ncbi:uncharacterized protein LOC110696611 isoform X2 [Chenopodium quinoa]|uniref:uncharacterized protein LOC110696611 isoform X2 n=1 Tax=Chenopodium quinoa TaxID=63459 RepID=UPI000B797ABE|nr:uncharacterized protein LOC110696611 isoform X2 [Chenopodium quinoa]
MNSSKPLDSIPPTDSVEITNGLTLTPRIKLRLTIHHADASVSPLDEWKLKRSLINFLKSSFSIPITIPEEDLIVRRFKDLKKRKREDAVAVASLFIRDLGFIVSAAEKIKGFDGGDGGLEEVLEKKFLEWRIVLVEKMDGMEVNLEGVKFRVSVNLPVSDDFEKMKKEWQEFYAFGPGTDTDADDEDLISGLQCKVVVQFDQYKEFYNALKVLCSRSLKKEGSRMKADCELTWDKDGFFQHARRYTQEGNSRIPTVGAGQYRNERRSSYNSRHSPDDE